MKKTMTFNFAEQATISELIDMLKSSTPCNDGQWEPILPKFIAAAVNRNISSTKARNVLISKLHKLFLYSGPDYLG